MQPSFTYVVKTELVSLTTLATLTAIATGTLTTLTSVATLRTLRTGGTLLVTLGLRDQHTVRELELTGLRVDVEQFHGDLVALFQTSLLNRL